MPDPLMKHNTNKYWIYAEYTIAYDIKVHLLTNQFLKTFFNE